MKKMGLLVQAVVLISLICMVSGGCSGEDESEGDLTKEEAAEMAKSDSGFDYCKKYDWYDDGVCDDFCLNPDPDCCDVDADCERGREWCEEGECVPCSNGGLFCALYCEHGFVNRNGCTPCACAVPCDDDADCERGWEWCEGGKCVPCDNSGKNCDLECEHGFVERNGCISCECAGPCDADADCERGQEWCEEGKCVPCSNGGLFCALYCEYGFVHRNGCTPCACAVPCDADADCERGWEWCEEGKCVPCDNSGENCDLECEHGFVERNGCISCECA